MSAPPRPARRVASGDPQRLTVGIIGAGRVGTTLGAALARAGHTVAAVTASSTQPDRLRAALPQAPVRPLPEVVRDARDLLLIAVPDDSLVPLVTGLGQAPPGQVVAHTSGAHGTAVLRPLTAGGARAVALHPAMTFTGSPEDLDRLPGIRYGVTADDSLRPFVTRLVADLGGSPEWVAEPARPLYHAALAHGANHLVTLVNEAADRLRQAGVRQPAEVLGPLLRAALGNALRTGDRAVTGPVARGDAGTLAGHLQVLAEHAPESLGAYRALARRTTERLLAAGRLSPAAAASLLAALDPGEPAGVQAAGQRIAEPV